MLALKRTVTACLMIEAMSPRWPWIFALCFCVVSGANAKCMSRPNIRAEVTIESCVAATFTASDSGLKFLEGQTLPLYEKGSTFSGTIMTVVVEKSRFYWEDSTDHRTNGFRLWTHGERLSVVVSKPVGETCPSSLPAKVMVHTSYVCCDTLPKKGICVVPDTLIPVEIAEP
jgi:hypothetical protein